jgi:hypothetical protein
MGSVGPPNVQDGVHARVSILWRGDATLAIGYGVEGTLGCTPLAQEQWLGGCGA